jgi:hypothetical protein
VRFQIEPNGGNDTIEGADVREELGDSVIATHDRHLVPVGIELFPFHNGRRFDSRDIESDAASGGRDILE